MDASRQSDGYEGASRTGTRRQRLARTLTRALTLKMLAETSTSSRTGTRRKEGVNGWSRAESLIAAKSVVGTRKWARATPENGYVGDEPLHLQYTATASLPTINELELKSANLTHSPRCRRSDRSVEGGDTPTDCFEGRVLRLMQALERKSGTVKWSEVSGGMANVQCVIDILSTRYREAGVSIKALSSELKVPERYLGRACKQQIELPFRTIIRMLRVTEALIRLQDDVCLDIKRIAFAVGYSDESHFCLDFRREVGCTPKQFRHRVSESSPL
jgi:AraC-like DNA-binding protein